MSKGLPVVFEGAGDKLSRCADDTCIPSIREKTEDGRVLGHWGEKEINYVGAEDHELDDPQKRMALLRLARAMKYLDCEPAEGGIEKCSVTICMNRELLDSLEGDVKCTPFDTGRLIPLSKWMKELQENAVWKDRIKREA